MAKLLLMAAAAAVVMTSLGSGGRPVMVAAQRSAPVVFSDDGMPPAVVKEAPSCTEKSQLGSEVCDEDPEYNDVIKQRVMSLLRQNTGVNALFSDPSLRAILSDPEQPAKVDLPKVSTRLGVSETPVCAAQETIIFPKRAKTPRDDWVFVLNQEGVQQALRVEKCISDGSSCNIGMTLPGNAKATCRQKYVYRRMLVLGTNRIEPDQVLMPSCCVCYTTFPELFTRSRNATRSQGPETQPSASPILSTPGSTRINFGRSFGGHLRRPLVLNFEGPVGPIRYPDRG